MGLRLSSKAIQLIVLALFAALCATVFGYLWVNSGGKLPGITKPTYRLTATFPRVANLVYFGDVMVAGVKVGKVMEVTPQAGEAKVVMDFDSYAPLHQGAVAQVRAKTLVEESFIEIADGTGPALPSGSVLPKEAGKPPTQLNDVLLALDGKTRGALAESMRSLGAATEGTKQSVSDAVTGLGSLGRGGADALDALADQSEDLKQVAGHTSTMLAALNTQRGQIAQLVEDSNRLFTATADGQKDLEETMRTLPPVLASARNASAAVTDLGNALQPVARNLHDAAPDLSDALDQLPGLSHDLRKLMPYLDEALRKAPDTLHRVPDTAHHAQELIPHAEGDLGDLNPMLGYLKPYGPDVGGFLANFAQTLAHGDANGNYFNTYVFVNEQSYKGMPVSTNIGPLRKFVPYVKPGGGYTPGADTGARPFTRVEKESPGR
jgi:phospholipid/cholesterol/gamma-HCH transport system substrate-binding protein